MVSLERLGSLHDRHQDDGQVEELTSLTVSRNTKITYTEDHLYE